MNTVLILNLLSSLTPVLSKLVGAGNADLIASSENVVGQLWAAYQSGGSLSTELSAALFALQAEAEAVAKDTNADPALAALAEELLRIIQDAVDGITAAENGRDPSTLPVPAPIV